MESVSILLGAWSHFQPAMGVAGQTSKLHVLLVHFPMLMCFQSG